MELRVLQYFLAIAREETISGAAEYLHITQPTLSRQMHDLEDEIGKKLFERGNRKIILTEEGMLLRKRAEEIIQLVEKTEIELSSTTEEMHGDIYIGGGETEGMRLIAKAITKMQKYHPQVKFHLYSGNAQDVSDKLEKGLIEFGLMIEPFDKSKYDYISLPHFDTWGVLLRADHPLANKDRITSQDIKQYPVICSNQLLVNNEISGWLGGSIRQMDEKVTYNLIFNAALVAEETNYPCLTLSGLVNTCGSNLKFIPLYPTLRAGCVLVWKKYTILSKPTECFLNIIKEMV